VHGDDPHVPVIAADIAARALTRFGEKMPKQIEAMMQKILADAFFAGVVDYISDQTKRGLSPRDARAVQAILRGVNQKMTASAHRQVWGAPQQGRPGKFNDDDVRAALVALGQNATIEAVAEHLGMSAERITQYRKNSGFESWEDLRRHFTQGV
jgi:DNA uptake protein ComE-like DNA-binding protein